jgi:hypothetical protein
MNNKPQQPKFHPAKLGLPSDILQVIERLKARGVVRCQGYSGRVQEPLGKTARETCKWCGVTYSVTYTKHVCKTHRHKLLRHV